MLQLARILTLPGHSVTWAYGTAENLRQPPGSATVVWSLAAVHHWKNVTMGLAEAWRVLVPGGRFLAIERRVRPGATGLASHGWTDQQAESFAVQCRAAGFENVRIEQHTGGRRAVQVAQALRP
jgi:ubiquinone/menaquinone biosynthesis C-methylase UbiE